MLHIFVLIDVHVLGTIEAHTDEDEPPPLPERTPESYVLAVDTGLCCQCISLELVYYMCSSFIVCDHLKRNHI